jgi:hypothetical protein
MVAFSTCPTLTLRLPGCIKERKRKGKRGKEEREREKSEKKFEKSRGVTNP